MTDQDGLEKLKTQIRRLHARVIESADSEHVALWHHLISMAFTAGSRKSEEKRCFMEVRSELQRGVYKMRSYARDVLKFAPFPKVLEMFGGSAPEQQIRNLSDRLEGFFLELCGDLTSHRAVPMDPGAETPTIAATA